MTPKEEQSHCGYVAIIGAPNAGKSTLINTMVGTKVSIVSPKVQTTRTRVIGICMSGSTQIVFVDTPGLFEPDGKKPLERAIVAAAKDGMADTDAIIFVVDAHRPGNAADLTRHLKNIKSPCILALNKIDKIKPDALLKLSQDLNQDFDFKSTFMISAAKGDGVGDLLSYAAGLMPQGAYLFPEDQVTDMPLRLMAAEITREKLFHKLHEELPYALTVETENWEEFRDGSTKIDQIIYVARDNHKGIVLGKGGSLIKQVGEAARKELEDILESRVHLKLFVKVRENWMNDPERYMLWGLDHKA